MGYALGVDIGGTKIACGIMNEQGELISTHTVPSDPSDREAMFVQVKRGIEELLEKSSIDQADLLGMGVGIPGKLNHEEGIAVFQNNLPWANFPIVDRLKEAFEVEKIVIDNDVYMATYAEWSNKDLTDETFVYLTVSTGISSAAMKAGEFLRGAGFAGEVGLIPVYTPNEKSPLTRLEQAASGPSLAKQANEIMDRKDVDGEKLFKLYYEGNQEAKEIIDHFIDSLTQGVYMINTILDPHMIVFGGSVTNHNPIIIDLIKDRLNDYMIDEQKHLLERLVSSRLGKDQGVIGACYRLLGALKAE